MKQFIIVILLGAALFAGAMWQFEMLDFNVYPPPPPIGDTQGKTTELAKLGGDLYTPDPKVEIPASPRRIADPIILYGVMNPVEQEEVASQVNGRVLFLGDQVEESAVLAAGSAAFLAEPYYFANVFAGRERFVMFYRRVYEGETIAQGQMLAMIEPGEALGGVLEEIAKIRAAHADHDAALAGEAEGRLRKITADNLFATKSIQREEHGMAVLTYRKLINEAISKEQAIKLAEIKKDQADIRLRAYEIRPTLPYKQSTIKTVVRQRGSVVKQGDTVVVVQNLSRLQAEALVEEQYFVHLKEKQKHGITATIEPTVLDKPLHEYPGHALDVTSVAVAKDMKIVSGSEDRSVCVWSQDQIAPLRKLEHDDAVRVVACTPVACAKNLCLVGCANGSIYLWDLAKDAAAPIEFKKEAHGPEAAITSLAFSPDGRFFASGASDGSIKMWSTWMMKKKEKAEDVDEIVYALEHYAFVPTNGVEHCHDDAVTSLHFTPQCRLISAGRDKTLRVWILKEKGAALDKKVIRDRVGNVPQLGVDRDGKWMLFDQGRTLKLYSVETHSFTHTLSTAANATPFDTLALFSPDSSLILTAGAPEGRLQLWRTPDGATRGFEVRQFATRERLPVTCAAFSPDAGKNSFAVSASGTKVYQWSIPTATEVAGNQLKDVRMTLFNQNLDATRNGRVGFEILNADGRFEAGRPVTIVID